MIGRGAAVAEVGKHHHELHGPVGFAAWLGVHAWLLSGVREKVDAFISWGWDNLGHGRAATVIDRSGRGPDRLGHRGRVVADRCPRATTRTSTREARAGLSQGEERWQTAGTSRWRDAPTRRGCCVQLPTRR